MVGTASAWCLLRGHMRNVVRRKQLNLLWHYPRGREKIWLTCWKLKYASQFPSCLSLTNDPSFTFLSSQHGLSQLRRQQIYVILLQWQPWNLGGEITAAASKTRGADMRAASLTWFCRGHKVCLSNSFKVHAKTVLEEACHILSQKLWIFLTEFQVFQTSHLEFIFKFLWSLYMKTTFTHEQNR